MPWIWRISRESPLNNSCSGLLQVQTVHFLGYQTWSIVKSMVDFASYFFYGKIFHGWGRRDGKGRDPFFHDPRKKQHKFILFLLRVLFRRASPNILSFLEKVFILLRNWLQIILICLLYEVICFQTQILFYIESNSPYYNGGHWYLFNSRRTTSIYAFFADRSVFPGFFHHKH